MAEKNQIEISFIIPTLNAQKVLEICLKSIFKQNFPKNKYEIIIADGGSTDKTVEIAKKYLAKIVFNPLKTAEAGKAIGIKNAQGKYLALIDSDNILPDSSWLTTMINVLEKDKHLIGAEPWKFTYRKKAGLIERYSALIGANDPYAFISGVYDRKNYINFKWTGLKIKTLNYKKYLKLFLEPGKLIPTIGANGTIFRTDFIRKNINSDYLFDIDIISYALQKNQAKLYFAKVKIGIIHTYCESSISKFIKKQNRRINDYYFYKSYRQYDWKTTNGSGILKFTLYTTTIFPAVYHSIIGFIHQPDTAWIFHPLACLITLYVYTKSSLMYKLGLLNQVNRTQWQQ